jgi:tetratricopeptide (TPR) repeat protein
MKQVLTIIVLVVLACAPLKKNKFSNEEKAVLEVVEIIKKDPANKEAKKILPQRYQQAVQIRLAKIESLQYNTNLEKWDAIILEYNQLIALATEISKVPVAAKIVQPQYFTTELSSTKNDAAEAYYNAGNIYYQYGGRTNAQRAFEYFTKCNQYVGGYKDVASLLSESYEASLLLVMVNPVNYYNQNWSFWGLQNDALQEDLVRDLRIRYPANSSVKFYTDREMRNRRYRPASVINVSWNQLTFPSPFTENYTQQRSKKIQVGTTNSKRAEPIYETVYATLFVKRQSFTATGSLHCIITENNSFRTLLNEILNVQYPWTESYATYKGDSRALTTQDWALIQNNHFRIPDKRFVYNQLYNQAYPQMIRRITSVIW